MKAAICQNFDVLGFIDRYESTIASVEYEFTEDYVLKMCTGEWAKPILEDLGGWMSPWMLLGVLRVGFVFISLLSWTGAGDAQLFLDS